MTGSSNISTQRVSEQRRGDPQPLAHTEGEAMVGLRGLMVEPRFTSPYASRRISLADGCQL